jgi:hypothetical protein
MEDKIIDFCCEMLLNENCWWKNENEAAAAAAK